MLPSTAMPKGSIELRGGFHQSRRRPGPSGTTVPTTNSVTGEITIARPTDRTPAPTSNRDAHPDGFPAVTAAMLSGSLQDEGDFAEGEFMFGPRTVLDGVDALMQRRSAVQR